MIIRTLRKERGWSQEQLAEISGVSSRTIQRIERGGNAGLESLKCLAAVFETPITELQKDEPMNDKDKYADLSEEDLAALKYARFLKSYDDHHGGDDSKLDKEWDMSPRERDVVREVRQLKQFYIGSVGYLVVVLFLLILNLMTSPAHLWVVWPAFGMAIPLVLTGLKVFAGGSQFGEEWERRKIEERLRRL
jgi:transcriptional regulator with XRE-family HTH domain